MGGKFVLRTSAGWCVDCAGRCHYIRWYNGTPSGFENICEDENNKTKPYVLHAEANAITKVAKSNNSSLGATLYVTASPCIECAKLIIQAGIRRVVYSENYRSVDGIELLQKAGIDVAFIELNENQENKD